MARKKTRQAQVLVLDYLFEVYLYFYFSKLEVPKLNHDCINREKLHEKTRSYLKQCLVVLLDLQLIESNHASNEKVNQIYLDGFLESYIPRIG